MDFVSVPNFLYQQLGDFVDSEQKPFIHSEERWNLEISTWIGGKRLVCNRYHSEEEVSQVIMTGNGALFFW